MNYLRVIFCLSQRHTSYDRELIFMLFRIFNHFCLSRPLVNDKRLADYESSFLDVQVEKKQCQHGDDEFYDSAPAIFHITSYYDSALFIATYWGTLPTFAEKQIGHERIQDTPPYPLAVLQE